MGDDLQDGGGLGVNVDNASEEANPAKDETKDGQDLASCLEAAAAAALRHTTHLDVGPLITAARRCFLRSNALLFWNCSMSDTTPTHRLPSDGTMGGGSTKQQAQVLSQCKLCMLGSGGGLPRQHVEI